MHALSPTPRHSTLRRTSWSRSLTVPPHRFTIWTLRPQPFIDYGCHTLRTDLRRQNKNIVLIGPRKHSHSKVSENIAKMKTSLSFLCHSFDEIKVSNKKLQEVLLQMKEKQRCDEQENRPARIKTTSEGPSHWTISEILGRIGIALK